MRTRLISSSALLSCAFHFALAQQPKVPNNGPRATIIHETNLYVAPDIASSRLTQVTAGREMVIVEHNGPWVRVFANTDAEVSNAQDAPVFGSEATAAPVTGWMTAQGIVDGTTPKGDLILFGAAATKELEASQPHAPQGTAQQARLLYQRMADFFPQSPLAPEAAWRSADIRWQLEKADIFSLPSAREKDAYLRETIDESEMHKIEKRYPNSKWSDLAAWNMLDNKVCGDWQGSTKCPEKEAEMYQRYAEQHPDSLKAPEALYQAAYRDGVLNDMYGADGNNKKADEAKAKAVAIAGTIESKYPQSDYAARAAALVYKLESSIPIYGMDRE
ncbi:MAG TPA: SH3 domain-containing protein [Acidobacteriaceae bacterium]|nr:SH3 domain-containing protein [Acidobacteriaceae bacterium]